MKICIWLSIQHEEKLYSFTYTTHLDPKGSHCLVWEIQTVIFAFKTMFLSGVRIVKQLKKQCLHNVAISSFTCRGQLTKQISKKKFSTFSLTCLEINKTAEIVLAHFESSQHNIKVEWPMKCLTILTLFSLHKYTFSEICFWG